MSPSLRTSLQFAPLERLKSALAARPDQQPAREMTARKLAAPLLAFELAKIQSKEGSDCQREQMLSLLGPAFDALLALDKASAQLDLSDLLDLHRLLVPAGEGSALRRQEAKPISSWHQPLAPAAIEKALQRFFEWSQSPAFGELHALEQTTLAQVRLYEIYPFERMCEPAVSFFSFSYLGAGGYLPPLYQVEELPAFYDALDQAFNFSTEQLIKLNLQACQRAYGML